MGDWLPGPGGVLPPSAWLAEASPLPSMTHPGKSQLSMCPPWDPQDTAGTSALAGWHLLWEGAALWAKVSHLQLSQSGAPQGWEKC